MSRNAEQQQVTWPCNICRQDRNPDVFPHVCPTPVKAALKSGRPPPWDNGLGAGTRNAGCEGKEPKQQHPDDASLLYDKPHPHSPKLKLHGPSNWAELLRTAKTEHRRKLHRGPQLRAGAGVSAPLPFTPSPPSSAFLIATLACCFPCQQTSR